MDVLVFQKIVALQKYRKWMIKAQGSIKRPLLGEKLLTSFQVSVSAQVHSSAQLKLGPNLNKKNKDYCDPF